MTGCIIIFEDDKTTVYKADVKQNDSFFEIGINENNCFVIGNDINQISVNDLKEHVERKSNETTKII